GKRNQQDERITDLLYECNRRTNKYLSFDVPFSEIEKRFMDIGRELGVSSVRNLLDTVYTGIRSKKRLDWIVSRGEWMMAKIMADFLKLEFVDAGSIIELNDNGSVNPQTAAKMKKFLSKDGVFIIPGFYGKRTNGEIKVFPRGGSDITG